MQRDNLYKKCCDILEVSPDASMSEIKKSYLHLKELYSSTSIVSMALEDEFTASDKAEILAEIDNAYHELMVLAKQDLTDIAGGEPGNNEAVVGIIAEIDMFDGPALKRIRKKMGITLDDIARATRIQVQYLSHLEHDNFEKLPPEVYTRGFVASYAQALSLDVKSVVTDYMVRYREWKSHHHKGGTLAGLMTLFKNRKNNF
ncbi:MAG: helix-turn-helix domain-containing protein [Deltaproteobacteria bacterium]|nr:helix-turn-helix domain-containing protein [Deltaproteobacteria bacterium]